MSDYMLAKILMVWSLFGTSSPIQTYEQCIARHQKNCAAVYRAHEFAMCFAVCESWSLCSAAAQLAYARATHQSKSTKDRLLLAVGDQAHLCTVQ